MRKKTIIVLCFILPGLLSILACKGTQMMPEAEILINIDTAKLQEISKKTIFFGHQSVGFNIIDGVQSLLKMLPGVHLNFKETSSPNDFTASVFGHARIGKNGNSQTKIDDFKKKLESGIADSVDIALMKLCYIDFNSQTNASKVFEYYKSAMADLASKYPNVHFLHCTAPLESGNTGVKGLIKTILGKKETVLANTRREEYNQLIRGAYGAAVLDIALAEARKTDGSIAKSSGVANLLNSYTDDGGHLNATGKKVVAAEFLKTICNGVN